MSAEDRREQLLAVAERVVARDGAAASMQSIADEAGVNKALLYRHFTDKSELYAALAEQQTRVLLTAMRTALTSPADTRTRTAAAIDAYLRHIETHASGYRLLTRAASREAAESSAVIADFAERLGDELAANIGADFGLVGDSAAQALALTWAHGLVGMVQAAADIWIDRRHVGREDLVEHLMALLWGAYPVFAAEFDERRRADPTVRPAVPPP